MASGGRAGGNVVLCVEGSEPVRKLAAEYLAKAGCTVQEATTMADGLELAKQSRPRLVLMDLALPEGTTHGLLKSFREIAELALMRVILVSHEVRPENVAPFIALGVQDYILKPFSGAEFYAKVNKALNLWKAAVPEEFLRIKLPWPEEVSVQETTTESGAPVPSAQVIEGPAYVTLPNTQAKAAQSTQQQAEDTSRADCLIVDDMANVTTRFRDLVPNLKVDGCTTVEEALEKARTRAYRVILVDMNMPNADAGLMLRQMNLFQTEASFYAMGLRTNPNLLEDARSFGFEGVLAKPFESSKVADLVDRHFASRDKIGVDDNVLTLRPTPPGAERSSAYFYRLCNEIPTYLERVAEACYSEAIINAVELRGTRKSVIEVLVKLKDACTSLGLEMFMVVNPEVSVYSREFVETRSLQMFATLEEAQDAATRYRGEQG